MLTNDLSPDLSVSVTLTKPLLESSWALVMLLTDLIVQCQRVETTKIVFQSGGNSRTGCPVQNATRLMSDKATVLVRGSVLFRAAVFVSRCLKTSR